MNQIAPIDPHQSFCAPAVARCQPWRTLAGLALTLLVPLLLLGAGYLAIWHLWLPIMEERQRGSGYAILFRGAALLREVQLGTTPRGVVMALASLALLLPGLWLALRLLHRRKLRSLFGETGRPLPAHFALGALVALGLVGAGTLLELWVWGGRPGLAADRWLVWLVPALLILLVQVSAEELVFRGYLQQQLRARWASPLGWLVLPSVLFGLLHYNPQTYGANAWAVVAMATLMGAIAAIVTARTGNLSAAIGLHFGNNMIAVVLVASPGQMDALALWRSTISIADIDSAGPSIMVTGGLMIAATLVWLRIHARRRARRLASQHSGPDTAG